MKRIVLLTTIAFLISGVSFSQEKPVEKKKCTMDCCKKKDVKKKDKCCDKATATAKPVAAAKAKKA